MGTDITPQPVGTPPPSGTEGAGTKALDKSIISYEPPDTGMPKTRIGAGTRGPGNGIARPWLAVIAPQGETSSYTVQDQPVFYWYQIDVSDKEKVLFTIQDKDEFDPLLEIEVKDPQAPGYHKFDLKDHPQAKLLPGKTYRWSVTIFTESQGLSSADIVASANIQLKPNAQLSEKLEQEKDATTRASILGDAGYWYDLFHELSKLLADQPENEKLIEMRNALLQKVELLKDIESNNQK